MAHLRRCDVKHFYGEGIVQTTNSSNAGGENRSGKHNRLVAGSNPARPTIFLKSSLNDVKKQ